MSKRNNDIANTIPQGTANLGFHVSAAMKRAIDIELAKRGKTLAEVGRIAFAEYLNLDKSLLELKHTNS